MAENQRVIVFFFSPSISIELFKCFDPSITVINCIVAESNERESRAVEPKFNRDNFFFYYEKRLEFEKREQEFTLDSSRHKYKTMNLCHTQTFLQTNRRRSVHCRDEIRAIECPISKFGLDEHFYFRESCLDKHFGCVAPLLFFTFDWINESSFCDF